MQAFFNWKKYKILQIAAKILQTKSTIIFEQYMLIVLFIHSFVHIFIIIIFTTFKKYFYIEEYLLLFTIRVVHLSSICIVLPLNYYNFLI